MAAVCIDPFGAPEYLVDDIAFRSMVGTDYLRMGFYTQEPGEQILRVKIVFPVRRLFDVQADTRLFITRQHCQVQRLTRMAN